MRRCYLCCAVLMLTFLFLYVKYREKNVCYYLSFLLHLELARAVEQWRKFLAFESFFCSTYKSRVRFFLTFYSIFGFNKEVQKKFCVDFIVENFINCPLYSKDKHTSLAKSIINWNVHGKIQWELFE